MRSEANDLPVEMEPKAHQRRDLRKALRVLRATGHNTPKTLFGYARNISRSGMQIATISPKRPGTSYDVEFSLPEPSKIVARCRCEVVWTRDWAKKTDISPGMGLKFLDLPEDTAAAIDEWVTREAIREIRLGSTRPRLPSAS